MGSFFAWTADQTLGVIDQVVDGAIGALYDIDEVLLDAIKTLASWIWDALKAIWQFLSNVWGMLATWIKAGVHWLFHTLLPDLVRWVNEIRAKITAWLHPLIQWIQYERALLNQFYNNVLKPILNLIQRLRSILVVFRLLHLGWATRLDQYLADVEEQIAAKFLQMVQSVQMVANWINWLTDPTGLFNVPLLLLSQLQTLPQLFAALWGLGNSPLGAADLQSQQADAASGTYSNAQSDIIQRGSNPTTDDLTRYTDIVQLYQADGYVGG